MTSLLLALVLAAAEDDCAGYLQHALPAESARSSTVACESQAAFDSGDFATARRCAWAERAKGEESVFGGSSTLLAIYANGLGVPRDFGLARRLACEAGGAPAEVENRLEHLAAMEAGKDTEPFDFCDDITSGYMMGFCSQRDAEKSSAKRDAARDAMLAAWPAAHREAWGVLNTAAQAFFEARVAGEVDVGGTGRAAFIVGETEALEQGLFEHMQNFERGALPVDGDLAAADKQLNESYAAARAAAKFDDAQDTFGPLGTIRPEGIRDAERAWIKYRDAWVVFGKVRYPTVSAAAWQRFFTLEREGQLRALVEGY